MSNRKLLLSYIREGHYAHAGEEEAIEIALQPILKQRSQTMLDIGCGLGGTANYIQNKKWGVVSGIEIDATVLQQAKLFYPTINFYHGDAHHASTILKLHTFDVFYSFNAFFCFTNQFECLQDLVKVSSKNAKLVIFDYSSPSNFTKPGPFLDSEQHSWSSAIFTPINLSSIEVQLANAGWRLLQIINLNKKYQEWYQSLVLKMERKQEELIQRFKVVVFNDLYQGYSLLLDYLDKQQVGGCVVLAEVV